MNFFVFFFIRYKGSSAPCAHLPGTRLREQRLEMDEVLTVAEQLAREQDKVDAFIADVGEETFAILEGFLLLECVLAHRWMPSLPRSGRKHLPRALSGR